MGERLDRDCALANHAWRIERRIHDRRRRTARRVARNEAINLPVEVRTSFCFGACCWLSRWIGTCRSEWPTKRAHELEGWAFAGYTHADLTITHELGRKRRMRPH